jgi:pyrroline-5-carboxylate reductase
MEKKFKLGVIGAGFMSSAIISGIISSKNLKPSEILVSDINDIALSKMQEKGVNTTKDNVELVENCNFILLAIKPQTLSVVANEIGVRNDKKVISIMAGVTKNRIKEIFTSSFVARAMPNTPCSIGYGAVGLDVTDFTDETDKEFVKNVFTALATVEFVSEDMLNAVTGVSGSSPAYFYLFLKCIVDASVKQGLKEEVALNLAVNTMRGSAEMVMKNQDKTLDELINAVCSKGGTTIEAIKVFEDNKLNEIVDKAVTACVNRAEELSKSL